MTDRLTKFSNPDDLEFERQNLCHRAQGDGWWRWEITASGSLVRRLWDIVSRWEPPFLLLYLLVVSRGEPEGRYESPELASWQEVENFLAEFWDFLEADGRHNLWIRSERSKAFAVLDSHEILYVYGDAAVGDHLRHQGFSDIQPEIPSPHAHHYHPGFDSDQRTLLEWCA